MTRTDITLTEIWGNSYSRKNSKKWQEDMKELILGNVEKYGYCEISRYVKEDLWYFDNAFESWCEEVAIKPFFHKETGHIVVIKK